jgi:hypothetical protein
VEAPLRRLFVLWAGGRNLPSSDHGCQVGSRCSGVLCGMKRAREHRG